MHHCSDRDRHIVTLAVCDWPRRLAPARPRKGTELADPEDVRRRRDGVPTPLLVRAWRRCHDLVVLPPVVLLLLLGVSWVSIGGRVGEAMAVWRGFVEWGSAK